MDILGIDEAGRGPVIGPLVVAGVLIKKSDERILKKLGVRDSKLLSPEKREILEGEIKKRAKNVRVVIIPARQIDEYMKKISLNQIEMDAMINIINTIGDTDKTIIDLPSTSKTFVPDLESKLTAKTRITAEYKADVNHISVGAASIIAKVERDRQVRALEKEHGLELGSGYPSDPATKRYMESLVRSRDTFPDYVRKSWKTTKDILEKKTQKTLARF